MTVSDGNFIECEFNRKETVSTVWSRGHAGGSVTRRYAIRSSGGGCRLEIKTN